MSAELAKEARAKMRQKAHDMAHGDPHQKVDASDWTPPEPLHTEAKTGERPVSKLDYKRGFKRGGKVEGESSAKRADRMPRKSGGRTMTADSYLNRDVKEANEERPGWKHDGGYKRGGQVHSDAKEDRALVREMVEKKAIKPKERGFGGALGVLPEIVPAIVGNQFDSKDKPNKRSGGSISMAEMNGTRPTGGRIARKHGGRADAHWIAGAVQNKGALHKSLHVPEGEKIPAKKLEKAEHSSNKLVAKRAHLAETLRGLNHGERKERASGGRTGKGKMNVNIVIQTGKPGDMDTPQLAAPVRPPMPVPAPPPQIPPQMAGPPAGMVPPPMGRKAGGRVHMEAGAGSGEGRLEKIKEYGKNARR
jgi:hypothetical protein